MRIKSLSSLIVIAMLAAACMPQPQPEPEVSVTEIPAPAEPVVEEPEVEEPVMEETMPPAEQPAEPEMQEEAMPAALAIPRDFQVNLYQGQDVYGSAVVPLSTVFADGKPVVVNFYAGLCPLCITELPAMQAVYDRYNGQVNFILVDIGPYVGLGSEQDGMNMLNNLGVRIPGGSTPDVDVIRDYSVLGTPSISFFRPDGSLHFQRNGVMNEGQIEEQVLSLLQ